MGARYSSRLKAVIRKYLEGRDVIAFLVFTNKTSQLTFSGMGATKMACPDMDIETSFFKVLEDTKSFIIKNDKLTLKDSNNVIAVFKAQKETPKKE